jgi:hypothetical protein
VHLANFILWLSRALQPPPFYGYEGIGVAELFDNLNRCAVLFSMTLLCITWPMGLWTRVVFSKRGLVCLLSALQLDSVFFCKFVLKPPTNLGLLWWMLWG